MLARVSGGRSGLVRCALLRDIALFRTSSSVQVRAFQTTIIRLSQSLQRSPAIDPQYVAWQKELAPQLVDLDHNGLGHVLREAEKRLPLLPGRGFMDAWFDV